MNNKKLGNSFEAEVCSVFAMNGYWVHFLAPDVRGAQPFDIIAVKDGRAVAMDCKTCVANTFNISRLEDNQIMAFEKWLECGNDMPLIVIKHDDAVFSIRYDELKERRSINIKGRESDDFFALKSKIL